MLAQIRAIDPDAADDEDRFWAVAAEEVGYGMRLICHLTGSDGPPGAPCAAGLPTAMIENSVPASAILAAMAAQGQ